MSEPTNDLGVIVNDREGQVKELTLDEAIIPIRVPDSIFDKFVRAAQHFNYPNVEAWCGCHTRSISRDTSRSTNYFSTD